MNQEEYKSIVQAKYNNLRLTLSRNLAIGVLGLGISFGMLVYNMGLGMDLAEKSKYTIANLKTIKEVYSAIDKMQNIQNIAIGIGGTSGLYLLLGLSIPIAKYVRKKKSLEKELD